MKIKWILAIINSKIVSSQIIKKSVNSEIYFKFIKNTKKYASCENINFNHVNLVEDIKAALNKITSTNCKHFYNYVQTILNKYRQISNKNFYDILKFFQIFL